MIRLSNYPQNINKTTWYYEEIDHISLIKEIRDNQNNYLRTETIRIPRYKLEKSLYRINEVNKRIGKKK